MSAQLVPLNKGAGYTIALQRPVLLIGRHPECDIRMYAPSLSRRHCCVALVDHRVVIRDLGSRHGIYVNGEPVEEVELANGDEVAIGSLIYRFDDDKPPPPPTDKAKQADSQMDVLDDFDDDLVPIDL